MAYTFLPVRRANYFPPSPPYLAGLGLWGVGLGDYAADKAVYDKAYRAWMVDHKKWELEKILFDKALAKYNSTVASNKSAYDSAYSSYSRSKSMWDRDYANYLKAIDTHNTQYAGIKRANTDKSLTIAKSYGLTLPQSYWDRGACLTQAEHDDYARQCQTVKGLYGLGSSDKDCGYKLLPVCAYPTKPTMWVKPTPPSLPATPAVPSLRAEPAQPKAPNAPPVTTTTIPQGGGSSGGGSPITTIPDSGIPTGPQESPQDDQRRGMIMNGLILVAVLGGGYLVYRTLKKPKAQAA